MSLWKMDKSLKELHKKLEEERMLRELPGLVAGIEDAMCEQDMASEERLATIEDSLCEQDAATDERVSTLEDAVCELDAAVNK